MKTFSQFILEIRRPIRDMPKKTFIVHGMTGKNKKVAHVFTAVHAEHARQQFYKHYKKLGDKHAYTLRTETPDEAVETKKKLIQSKPARDAARAKTRKSLEDNKEAHADMQRRVDVPSKRGKYYKGD